MFEILPQKQDGPQAERIFERTIVPLIQRERSASVIVPEKRNRSIGPRYMHQEMEHDGDLLTDSRRELKPVLLRKNERLKVKVKGVAMVIGGEFAINAVTQDLL